MVADRLGIMPGLSIRALCDLAIQLELARNHRLREVAFANEVRDDGNVFDRVRIKEKDRVAQAGFFFPKRALHIIKNVSSPYSAPMRQRRRARIRIHLRSSTDAI